MTGQLERAEFAKGKSAALASIKRWSVVLRDHCGEPHLAAALDELIAGNGGVKAANAVPSDANALQSIVDGLDVTKRVAGVMRKQAYEQQELRRAAEYRAEQLSQALRSVCTEVRLMRACDPNQCGTRACPYAHCEVGSAMKLLDKLELDTRREST